MWSRTSGTPRHEIVEHRREHRARECRHQPDAQFAGHFAGQRARFLGGVLQRADSLHAALVVAEPGWRGRYAAGRALEQLDLERALDRCHVLGDAGLRRVFPLRRTGKGAFLAHRDDGADLPQRDSWPWDAPRNVDIRKTNDRNAEYIISACRCQPA